MSQVKRLAGRRLQPRALLGLLFLIGGTVIWLMAFTGGISSIFGGSTHTIKANFGSIENIAPNDPVRVSGVQIGSVGNETMLPRGRGAQLTLNLDSSAPPIYRDASANILWRTALGANDAVDIYPGTRSAGLLGHDTLPMSQDSNQVELDQITQGAFHGGAQPGLRTMLPQLATAFHLNPQTPVRDFDTLARVAPNVEIGVGALRGELPDTDLKNLVREAGQAAQAISVGTGASDTRRFVESAATTLAALSASRSALRMILGGRSSNSAPTTSAAIFPGSSARTARLTNNASLAVVLRHTATDGLAVVRLLRGQVDPLVAKLYQDAPQLAPTLAALRPTVTDVHALLTDATPLLRKLRPSVNSVAAVAKFGVPVINAVSPSLKRLEGKILPGLAEKYPEEGGHTEYQMIGPVFVGLGGLSAFFNSDGHAANLTAGIDVSEPQGAEVLPCSLNFAGTDFLVCESLSETLAQLFGGGASVLSSLVKRPGGATIYAPLLQNARKALSALNATKQALTAKNPAVAKYVFQPNHGGLK